MGGIRRQILGCTGNFCVLQKQTLQICTDSPYRYWTWDWSDGHIPLAGVDANINALLINDTYSANLAKANLGARYYVTNLLSELDNEGEYYISRSGESKGMLYFKPKDPQEGGLDAVFVSAASQVRLNDTCRSYKHTVFIIHTQ